VTTDVSDDVLGRIRRYRQVARTVVESSKTVRERCLGLLELIDAARDEADSTVRHWAEMAIWQESKGFLGVEDENRPLPPESYEHRQRRLRLMGEDTCGRCLARIATEDELRRWNRIRLEQAELRNARRGAVT
jgi:hypothetical protein